MVEEVTERGHGFYDGLWFAFAQRTPAEEYVDWSFSIGDLVVNGVGLEGIIDYFEQADEGGVVEECVFRNGDFYTLRIIDTQAGPNYTMSEDRLNELTKGAVM